MGMTREEALDKVDKLSLFTPDGFKDAFDWIDNNIFELAEPELYADLRQLAKDNALKHGRFIK